MQNAVCVARFSAIEEYLATSKAAPLKLNAIVVRGLKLYIIISIQGVGKFMHLYWYCYAFVLILPCICIGFVGLLVCDSLVYVSVMGDVTSFGQSLQFEACVHSFLNR